MRKFKIKRISFFLEIVSWVVLLASFGVAVYGIRVLPETIATHFDAAGNTDGFGSSSSLLILPIIMTLCNGLISLISHVVGMDAFNLPYQVKEEKREAVYLQMLMLMSVVELEISILTLWVQIKSFHQDGKNYLVGMGIFFGSLTVTIVIGCLKGYRENKEDKKDETRY